MSYIHIMHIGSLWTDYEPDRFSNDEIQIKRDQIAQKVSQINKKYPGTDNEAFTKAQENIKNYMFDDLRFSNIIDN